MFGLLNLNLSMRVPSHLACPSIEPCVVSRIGQKEGTRVNCNFR